MTEMKSPSSGRYEAHRVQLGRDVPVGLMFAMLLSIFQVGWTSLQLRDECRVSAELALSRISAAPPKGNRISPDAEWQVRAVEVRQVQVMVSGVRQALSQRRERGSGHR